VALSRRLLEDGNCGGGFPAGSNSSDYGDEILSMLALGRDHGRWEPLAVGLNLANDYLGRLCRALPTETSSTGGALPQAPVYAEGPRVPSMSATASASDAAAVSAAGDEKDIDADLSVTVSFCAALLDVCRERMEHSEPRVRSLVAKGVGSHARYCVSVNRGLPHSVSAAAADLSAQRRGLYRHTVRALFQQLAMGRDTENKSKSSEGTLDDTTGWRSLETNLHTIAAYINGCGGTYVEEEGQTLTDAGAGGAKEERPKTLLAAITFCSINHVNRHVRAAAIQVLEQIIVSVVLTVSKNERNGDGGGGGDSMALLSSADSGLRGVLVEVIKISLSDNWSQVRMAGSVLARVFLVALMEHESDQATSSLHDLDTVLLPRMCLNRFYLAQGVKIYSHETWRIVFAGGDGLGRVAECAGPVCRYYCKMCDADNHAVREAACQAVAELASKIGSHPTYSHYLSPYVPVLLQALLMCFHDESWPVRDEACLACGIFCRAYPEECEPELKTLFERWMEQLTDQIWSCRENAAVALGDAIVAYGKPMFDEILAVAQKNIPSARNQAEMTREEYKRRQNDIDAHTNSQLYSCGSLAPKLRKGGAGRIGCSSCAVTREKALWEETDGAIYLIREMCVKCTGNVEGATVTISDDVLLPLLTELADVCRVKHFPQSDDLRTTLWRQLPVMANALGKNRFKRRYLHLFIDLLAVNIDADRSGSGASQLSVHSAGQCAEELGKLVGMSILRGRFEEVGREDVFDRAIDERRMAQASGPPPNKGISPFGPPGLIPSTDNDGISPFGPPGLIPSTGDVGIPRAGLVLSESF